MAKRRTYRNGESAQIQSLVDAMGDFRQEMGQHVGELKTGQEALTKSLDEFKGRIEGKVDEHDKKINQAKGTIGAFKWIVGTVGVSGLVDAFLHVKHFLNGGK